MTEGFRPSHPKIEIDDDPGIRAQIEALTGELSQQQLAKWALIIAKKALQYVDNQQNMIDNCDSQLMLMNCGKLILLVATRYGRHWHD
ncbi:hypothetical protein [Lactiplantibacillus plantarum]|uniref:hypothetical protein n=1 Tax=Lactiplantibacillus plantarum TaxID=1590 RepID=UPI0007BC6635|nr:hypothetical protein [Lactiplantibacillus plantarum]KZU79911.1 hypothetical protein Nizo3400_2472 [Lactiplantibacillus plantarum]